MLLKLFTLELLAVAMTMAISAQNVVMLDETMKPPLEVPSGSSLILHCCLSTSGRARFFWYFSDSGPSLKNAKELKYILINKPNSLCKDLQKTYSLSQVNETHSGWYFCVVQMEIPNLMTTESKGRRVIVSSVNTTGQYPTVTREKKPFKDNTSFQLDWWMWVLVGVGSLVLIIMLIICVLCRRRHRSRGQDDMQMQQEALSSRGGHYEDHMYFSQSAALNPARRHNEGKQRCKH